MTRFSNIPEYEDFFKSLKLSLLQFGNSYAVSPNRHFADILFITGNNKEVTFNNLLSMNTGKDLKARELFLLLDTLGEHKKPFLDFIARRYDLVCSNQDNQKSINNENLKDLLLLIGGTNGDLINTFITSNQDKKLSEKELKELIKISYNTRALLNQFESDLKDKIKGLDYDI